MSTDHLGFQSRRSCSIPGCSGDHHCKGLCQKHYRRQARTGRTTETKIVLCSQCRHPNLVTLPVVKP